MLVCVQPHVGSSPRACSALRRTTSRDERDDRRLLDNHWLPQQDERPDGHELDLALLVGVPAEEEHQGHMDIHASCVVL